MHSSNADAFASKVNTNTHGALPAPLSLIAWANEIQDNRDSNERRASGRRLLQGNDAAQLRGVRALRANLREGGARQGVRTLSRPQRPDDRAPLRKMPLSTPGIDARHDAADAGCGGSFSACGWRHDGEERLPTAIVWARAEFYQGKREDSVDTCRKAHRLSNGRKLLPAHPRWTKCCSARGRSRRRSSAIRYVGAAYASDTKISSPLFCHPQGFSRASAPILMAWPRRHPARRLPGDWYVDKRCGCGAARTVAPGLIVERDGQSVFAHQPKTEAELAMAWRARLLCPKPRRSRQEPIMTRRLMCFPRRRSAAGVYRLGFSAACLSNTFLPPCSHIEGPAVCHGGRSAVRVRGSRKKPKIKRALGHSSTHRDDVARCRRQTHRKSSGAHVWIHPRQPSSRAVAPHRCLQGSGRSIGGKRSPRHRVPGYREAASPISTTGAAVHGDSLAWSFVRATLSPGGTIAGTHGLNRRSRSLGSQFPSNGCLPVWRKSWVVCGRDARSGSPRWLSRMKTQG
jgi:hypothetical protein